MLDATNTTNGTTSALAMVDASATLAAPGPDLTSARSYAAAAKSEATKRAYSRAWAAFAAWCEDQGVSALPATGATVAASLAHRADEGAKPASLDLYLAAISEAHRCAHHASPRESAEVRAVRAGIRRTHGTAQRRAAPATAEVVRAMVTDIGADLGAQRDRALVLAGFAGAFRRSELVALDVADLTFTARGVEVVIRRSKTDQEGAGRTVAIPFGASAETCPVRALRAWLDASGITSGPIFRSVDRHGRIGASLSDRAVASIVKEAAQRSGLDAAAFSGHSLRAGLATSAAHAGRSDRAIMAQTGHRSRAMVDRYVRAADAWRDNAAAGLL
jgi:integrase